MHGCGLENCRERRKKKGESLGPKKKKGKEGGGREGAREMRKKKGD